MASNLPSTIDLTQSLHMAGTDEGPGHARSARSSSDDRNIKNTITILVQDKCLAGGPTLILRVVRGATGLDDLGSKPLTPRRKGLGALYRCLTWRDLRVGRRKKLRAIARNASRKPSLALGPRYAVWGPGRLGGMTSATVLNAGHSPGP